MGTLDFDDYLLEVPKDADPELLLAGLGASIKIAGTSTDRPDVTIYTFGDGDDNLQLNTAETEKYGIQFFSGPVKVREGDLEFRVKYHQKVQAKVDDVLDLMLS